jgi:membrane protein implicated in regulation of membrane protease activity
MSTLVTVYWLCFGIGLVYVLIAGTLGVVSHGLESLGDGGADLDLDHDVDADVGMHDFDVGAADIDAGSLDLDTGVDFDVDHDLDLDLDHDADLDVGTDHGDIMASGHPEVDASVFPDWNPLSPLSLAGFLCAFGGAGLIAGGLGLTLWTGLAVAAGGGILMAFLLWLLIGKIMYSMQGTSQAKQIDMIGLEAEVLTPVEDDISGEIAYILEGVRYTAPAKLLKEGRIEKRSKVRIKKVRGNVVYVEEKKKLLT